MVACSSPVTCFMFISTSWPSCFLSRSGSVACFYLIAVLNSVELCLISLHLKLFLYVLLWWEYNSIFLPKWIVTGPDAMCPYSPD